MRINPGEFKQTIVFQVPSTSKDADGFPIAQPIEYLRAKGKLETLKGRSFYAAAQNSMEHNREFTIRYSKKLADGIRPHDLELVWNQTTHEIVSIENDNGLNQTMTVICKAVS
jgi:SPP1 family predicted phage head-tail adaptor